MLRRRILNNYNPINPLNKTQVNISPMKGKFRDKAIIEHKEYICSKVLHGEELGSDKHAGFILGKGNTH